MKKLSLILALVLVLTCGVLAACGDKTEESSAAESVAESVAESTATSTEESTATSTEESAEASTEASAEASTEESVEESTEASTEESVEESIPEGTAADSPKGKNVALNKSYTGADVAITTGDGIPCTYSANLTDGQASSVGTYDNSWFAFWYNSDSSLPSNNAPGGIATVVIDLEKAVKDINAIRINLFNANTSGIAAAEGIVAYVSEDNTNWTAVGSLVLPEGNDPAWASIAVDDATAQYVKLVIDLGPGGSWCFANEIEVYA